MTDDEQLKLLSIFHYVVAGLAGLFSLFPLFHLFFGIVMVRGGFDNPKDTFPVELMGWFFIIFSVCFICAGQAFAWCLFVAGRNLAARRRYTFCLVMAALACIFMPFGTVLGVFTIIVLTKEQVKARFLQPSPGTV